MDDEWDFSDADLEQLFQEKTSSPQGDAAPQPAAEEAAPTPFSGQETFSEIGVMCRRIAVQYVDIVASYAALTFRNKGASSTREAVSAAATALLRLAEASHDEDLIPLSKDLLAMAESQETTRSGMQRQRRELRDWLTSFIEYLPESDRAGLRKIIEYDFRTQPLLRELSDIRGIGSRRLQSLYTAGLFEAQVLSTASPDEIVAATGIPLKLAEEAVATAKEYARSHQQRTVESIRRMVAELARTVKQQQVAPEEEARLLSLARESLEELHTILQESTPQ